MVFRIAADTPHEGDAPTQSGVLARVDASGRPGASGNHGAVGRDGVYPGEDGGPGFAATHPSPGISAGSIEVRLISTSATDPEAVIESVIQPVNNVPVHSQRAINFELAGSVELLAIGGAGGHGADGGMGGAGHRGHRGHDATRYSSGTSGGRGGDGGPGGPGSSGANGGDGGAIVVRTSEQDTHLLMLVTFDTRGGAGGNAGRNGRGGEPGEGGSGGSSHSWTETEHDTDSQGNSRTRTTHHSNPGGSRGPDGNRGRDAIALLASGSSGRPGSFAIEVQSDNGDVHRYSNRYDLVVTGFQHDNENRDGVYEPEEKVIVSRVTVKNTGKMPTPAHHDIVIGVVEGRWISAENQKTLTLPRSIAAGESYTFATEQLTFALHGHTPTAPGKPLAETEIIHLACVLPAARRRFGEFESTLDPKTGALVVQFPVQLSPITAQYSLAPGQATRLRFELTNIALNELGRNAKNPRELGVRFRLTGGELYEGEVVAFTPDGKRTRLDEGWHSIMPLLTPRSVASFELIVAVAPDARPYTSARFELCAELGYLSDPRTPRPVHLRDFTLRVGQPFRSENDGKPASVVFVTNNHTDHSELASWQSLCKELGLVSTVWDCSLEGSIDVLNGKHPFALAVVFDYAMDSAVGEVSLSEMIESEKAHRFANGASTLFVAGSASAVNKVIPVGAAQQVEEFAQWYWWPWSEPKQEELTREANRRHIRSQAANPGVPQVLVQRYSPSVSKKLLWGRKITLGTVETRASFTPAKGTISTLSTDAFAAHSPMFVTESATLGALISALPFAQKLGLLRECPLPFGERNSSESESAPKDPIVAAVVDDLLAEVEAFVAHRWKAGIESKEFASHLPSLAMLAKSQEGQSAISLESDEGKRMVELGAWLELLASACNRWWEWLPGAWGLTRGPALRALIMKTRKALETMRFAEKEQGKLFAKAVTARRKALTQAQQNARKELVGNPKGLPLLRWAVDRRFHKTKRRDAREILNEHKVLEAAVFDKLVAQAHEQQARNEQWQHATESSQRELLYEKDFAALMAEAERIRRGEIEALAAEVDANSSLPERARIKLGSSD